MKKLLSILALAGACFAGAPAMASEGGFPLEPAPVNTADLSSLQRGAKVFVNYCLNCHGASMMRYNRLKDIGLTDDQIRENLLFSADKVGETMTIAMQPKEAKAFFGAQPPDLSVIARARGDDWLYTYLRTFYRDDSRATGWNNLVFPSVGMPHVLWELQGDRRPVFDKVESHGHTAEVFKGWEQVTPGSMTPLQYDQAMGDLVAYLQWMAEPAQNTRIRVGVWVLLFLVMALVFVWRLNASYWKDVK